MLRDKLALNQEPNALCLS